MTTQRPRRPYPPRTGFLLQPPLPRRRRQGSSIPSIILATLACILIVVVWVLLAALGWAFVVYLVLFILKAVFGLDVPLLG